MKFSKTFSVILAAAISTAHGAVVTFTQASLTDFTGFSSGGNANGSIDGETTSMNQSDLSSPTANYQITAIAIAGQGVLKASVSETRTGSLTVTPMGPVFRETWTGGSGVNSQVSSYASFTDSLTVTAPGLAGQSGAAVFRFRVDGSTSANITVPTLGLPTNLAASGSSQSFNYSAGWGLYIGAVGQFETTFDNVVGESYAGGFDGFGIGSSGSGGGTSDGIHEFSVDFTYGEAFDIEYSLVAFLNVTNQDPNGTIIGELSASFLNTAELEEIEFRDSGGATVSSTSLATGSGTTYNVVPEPSALVLSAFALLPMLKRRR